MNKEELVIECSDLVDFQDAGPWRSYELYTYGSDLDELMKNATISEVDQDGGELDCYGLDDAANDVTTAAIFYINKELNKWKNKS